MEYKEPNGEMQEVSSLQCQSTINKVLPEALSGYFFFDGEHISDINNKGNVVKAVRGLMGLETINEAVDHFSPRSTVSVISKLQKELDVGQDHKHMRLKSDLIDAKGRLQKFEERLAQVKSEIEYFEERSKEMSDKILANADTKHRQEEKTRTERDVSFLERNQTTVEQEIVVVCHNFYRCMYIYDKTIDYFMNLRYT